ncbi:mediator of RNA polymerase II transcription subunit 10-like isoform X3 [Xenopus laevis]|uniref:Mediator of RNA polymerase II transcription subunit 10 n=1 Tax=Xenopus laevis TaxID=8355 RepID=A0A8J1L0V4_XENLA|nr:mediator of RNA polymerase II transcription subunit 10-like isoform X3 [Xenopus laevis]
MRLLPMTLSLTGVMNFLISGLQDIDKCRQQLHDITVPLEVFEYIDQGRNPQLYTKECLERALAKNEQVKGKIDTLKNPSKAGHRRKDLIFGTCVESPDIFRPAEIGRLVDRTEI